MVFALLALASLPSQSCTSTGKGGAADSAPGEGTIVYHELVVRPGARKRLLPLTQIVTTTEKAVQIFRGSLEGASETQVSRVYERLLKQGSTGSARKVTPEKFRELWARLEAAGLFTLPEYPVGRTPAVEPYFTLETERGRWVFSRPEKSASDPNTDGLLSTWNRARREFSEFFNAP